MKKIFLPVVITMFTAAAMAQTSTSTGTGTTTNADGTTTTGTTTGTTTTTTPDGVEPSGTISPRGTSIYNRDTAGTTDSMTTTVSGTTSVNQSGQTGTAAGGATRNSTTTGTATGGVNSTGTAAGTATTGNTTTGNTAGGATETLNDNQIAGVLMTINDAEMQSAKMGMRRARLPEVKEFARRMSAEHKGNVHDTKKMYRSYNKNTARSEVGVDLQTEAKNLTNELAKATRDGFDKAYIDQQVTLHEKALSTLNETLIPNVTDETLKSHLEKTRTAVTEHLNEAREIQTKIQ